MAEIVVFLLIGDGAWCEVVLRGAEVGLRLSFRTELCEVRNLQNQGNSARDVTSPVTPTPHSLIYSSLPRVLKTLPRTLKTPPRTLKTLPRTLKTHPRTMDAHPRTLKPYPRSLDAHPRSLNTHPRSLDAHPRTLEQPPRSSEVLFMGILLGIWRILGIYGVALSEKKCDF